MYLDWMGNTIGSLGSPGTRTFAGRPQVTLGTLGTDPVNTFNARFGAWEPAQSPAGLPATVPAGMFNQAPPVPPDLAPPVTPRYEELNVPAAAAATNKPGFLDEGGGLARFLANLNFRPQQVAQARPFAFDRPVNAMTALGGQARSVQQLFRPRTPYA